MRLTVVVCLGLISSSAFAANRVTESCFFKEDKPNILDLNQPEYRYLWEHQVGLGRVDDKLDVSPILPGAAMLSMALGKSMDMLGRTRLHVLRKFQSVNPLKLDSESSVSLQSEKVKNKDGIVGKDQNGRMLFRAQIGNWSLAAPTPLPFRSRTHRKRMVGHVYNVFDFQGLRYGESFRGIQSAVSHKGLGLISGYVAANCNHTKEMPICAGSLDSAFQLSLVALLIKNGIAALIDESIDSTRILVPGSIEQVHFWPNRQPESKQNIAVTVKVTSFSSENGITVDLDMFGRERRPFLSARDFNWVHVEPEKDWADIRKKSQSDYAPGASQKLR